MNRVLDNNARRLGFIEYWSRRFGSIVYAPTHIPLRINLEGSCNNSSRKKRELEIIDNKDDQRSINPLEFKVLTGEEVRMLIIGNKPIYDDYVITDSYGEIRMEFIVGCHIQDYEPPDLALDRHMSEALLLKAEEIGHGAKSKFELARRAYQYIHRLPFDKACASERIKTPRIVIKSNLSQDVCLCKSELFVDLCKVMDIPAREQGLDYYTDEQIRKYSRSDREPRKNNAHSYCAFYNRGWHLADPIWGGFGRSFRFRNYYRQIFTAKGFDSLSVKAERL